MGFLNCQECRSRAALGRVVSCVWGCLPGQNTASLLGGCSSTWLQGVKHQAGSWCCLHSALHFPHPLLMAPVPSRMFLFFFEFLCLCFCSVWSSLLVSLQSQGLYLLCVIWVCVSYGARGLGHREAMEQHPLDALFPSLSGPHFFHSSLCLFLPPSLFSPAFPLSVVPLCPWRR